jgi:hypothetical protein
LKFHLPLKAEFLSELTAASTWQVEALLVEFISLLTLDLQGVAFQLRLPPSVHALTFYALRGSYLCAQG